MLQTLSEDAADARHDTPYVPPERCAMRVRTPRLWCEHNHRDGVHRCVRQLVAHAELCVCQCHFKWDVGMRVVSDNG